MTLAVAWQGTPGRNLEGADIDLGNGVVLELATIGQSCPHTWGVWGVRIDGVLYREPRDLEPEPLRGGRFREWIEEATERAVVKAQTTGGPSCPT